MHSSLKAKKTKGVSKARTKADRVEAKKHLGDEPLFTDIPTDRNLRMWAKIKAYNWYAYFFEYEDWTPVILDHFEDQGILTPELEEQIKSLKYGDLMNQTPQLKMMRMIKRGWPADAHELSVIASATQIIMEKAKSVKKEEPKQDLAPKKPGRIESKLHDRLMDIEDQWMDGEAPPFSLTAEAKAVGETKQAISAVIIPWLKSRKDWAESELTQDTPMIPRPALKRRLTFLDKLIEEAEALLGESSRKPRKPKIKTPEQQVKQLLFLGEDPDTKVKSVDPASLVKSQLVLLYNVKYRTVAVYEAADDKGIQVRRTTLENIKENPLKWKLRKPKEVLDQILETQNKAKIMKVLESLKTKPQSANGRSNQDTVLLKCFR